MPIDLLNPDDRDPAQTHKHDLDTHLEFTDQEGVRHSGSVFDRGYTSPGNNPVYAVICEDNIQRSVVENNATVVEEA